MIRISRLRILLAVAAFLVTSVTALARDTRFGVVSASLGATTMAVYTYTPSGCEQPGLLFVFAGYNRNADDYRDRAVHIADRACLVVLAPLFERKKFPTWRYQRAGVWRGDRVQSRDQWADKVLTELVAWGRRLVSDPQRPYILFGHSAGAQFLARIAAYAPPSDVHRIVIANPSSHVLPSVAEPAPYGFAEIFSPGIAEERVREYLAQPITIYLGQDDTGDRLLVMDEASVRQGPNRYQRGLTAYRAAAALANRKSWPFNWRLVEVPGVGHSSTRMLVAPQALEAFGVRAHE